MSQFTAEQLAQMAAGGNTLFGAQLVPEAARLPAVASQDAQSGAQQQAQPAATGIYTPQDLAHMQAGTNAPVYAIDYTAPVSQVRQQIARLPEAMREDALRLWANHYVAQEAQGSTGIDDRIRAVSRGTLIGSFLDEANAATQGALHAVSGGYAGTPYDEALAYNRARDRRFDRTNPGESTLLQIGGGVASAVPVLSAPATVGQAVGRGIAYGTGAGALHGFGDGEGGFGNRVDNALTGAGYGAAFGLAAPLAVAGATRGIGAIRDAVSPTIARWRQGPDAAAETILAQQMARGGTSPAAIRLDLQNGQNAAVMHGGGATASRAPLPETIADTTDAMRRLTGSVYRAGGEAGDFTRNALEARQRGPRNPYAPQAGEPVGQASNVLETIERSLQIRSQESAQRVQARIDREMREQGNKLYKAAIDNSEPFDLTNVLSGLAVKVADYPPRSEFRRQLQRAIDLFAPGRRPGDRFPVDNIRRYDAAKKALDGMIESAQSSGNRGLARELTQFKQALDDVVFGITRAEDGTAGNITRNADYRRARDAWGNSASDLEAIDMGRRALRENSDVSVAAFRELTPRQQQLFRVGFLENARNSLGPRRSGDDATRAFTTLRAQELMSAIIPTTRGVFADRPARFGEMMQRQNRMTQTRNEALGNSKTAQRVQDDAALAGDTLSTMYNRFRQSPSLMNLGFEAVATVIQRVFAYRQDVALAMARRLLTTDREQQNQILRAIAARSRDREGLATFAQFLDRMAIATGMSAAGAATGAR